MKKYNLIVIAMNEEASATIKNQQFVKIEKFPLDIYEYQNNLLLITNIGLINAALAVSYIVSQFDIQMILNFGLAGSKKDKMKIGDIVKIKNSFHLANDATGFGYKIGQTPMEKQFYSSNISLFEDLEEQNLGSSDIFMNNLEFVNNVTSKFNQEINLFDMEGFAIYQVAYKFKIPVISIKIVSDILGKSSSNETQFKKILEDSSIKIQKLISEFIKENKYDIQ